MKNIPITSLVADALSLGSHWIYSQQEIVEKFGSIRGYSDPATSYHAGKLAGDFTHYGDQTMVLLRSLALHGRFDLTAFANEWRAFWESPQTLSYRDGATKATLANLRSGLPPEQAASPSNDIAGAARIAPLFLLKWNSEDDLIAAARAQTSFTHGDPAVVEAAEFFARVTLAVQGGITIPDALHAAALATSGSANPSSHPAHPKLRTPPRPNRTASLAMCATHFLPFVTFCFAIQTTPLPLSLQTLRPVATAQHAA
jgi:ADP-ribosylglycohydrolase